MQALRDYEVLLGTYEEFVIGYKLNDSRKDPKFEASFADHSHAGSGNYLQCNIEILLAYWSLS